jgi:hypothetical protein
MRKLGLILGLGLLMVLLLQSRVSAQAVFNLQSDIANLRAQVNQLQSQVALLSQSRGIQLSIPSRTVRRPGDPTESQIVDRLATLAIEAKDRLNKLEARVSRLEQRVR